MKYQSIYDLPEAEKQYTIILSDDLTFQITGEQKEKILFAKDQFIKLPNGEVFNRAFIRAIVLNKTETRTNALKKNMLDTSPKGLSALIPEIDYVYDYEKKVYKEIIKK